MILTLISLLIPAFSLQYSPPPLPLRLLPVFNALLPSQIILPKFILVLQFN